MLALPWNQRSADVVEKPVPPVPAIGPQTKLPLPSVVRALEPEQESKVETARLPPTILIPLAKVEVAVPV